MNITEQPFRMVSYNSKKWVSLVEKLHAELSLRQVETTPWFNYLAVEVLSRQPHGEHQKDSKTSVTNHRRKIPHFKLRRKSDRPFYTSYLLYRKLPSETSEDGNVHPQKIQRYLKGRPIYLSKNNNASIKYTSFQFQTINSDTVHASIKKMPSFLNVEPLIDEIEDGYNLELELMAYSESDSVYTPKITVFPPFDSSYLYDLVKLEQYNAKQQG